MFEKQKVKIWFLLKNNKKGKPFYIYNFYNRNAKVRKRLKKSK